MRNLKAVCALTFLTVPTLATADVFDFYSVLSIEYMAAPSGSGLQGTVIKVKGAAYKNNSFTASGQSTGEQVQGEFIFGDRGGWQPASMLDLCSKLIVGKTASQANLQIEAGLPSAPPRDPNMKYPGGIVTRCAWRPK
jgi:hypothetical protein